jgi:rootletin
LQKLEDTVLKNGEDYTLKGTEDSPSETVPARVRGIITKNFDTDDYDFGGEFDTMTSVNTIHIQEENRMLQSELNRVEDLLAATRAERDEIGIKYNALSEKVCFMIRSFFQGSLHISSLIKLQG